MFLLQFETLNFFTPSLDVKYFYTHWTPKIFLHPLDT